MFNRLLRSIIILGMMCAPSVSIANTCTCASNCDLHLVTNWQGCGGTFPQPSDGVQVLGGGSVAISQPMQTVKDIAVYEGGVLQRSGAAAQTLALSGAHLSVDGIYDIYAALECRAGSVCSLGADSTLPPLTIAFTGQLATACGGGACTNGVNLLVGQPGSAMDDAKDATFVFTGQEKAVTLVKAFTDGTIPDDGVECLAGASAPSPAAAIGDSMVFTSGRSQSLWYRITGTPGGGQCAGTACIDDTGVSVPCQYEITRNSTAADFKTMTLATGRRSTVIREPTPFDANADGVIDFEATRPAIHDGFVVFSPAIVTGNSNPATGGIGWLMGGVQADIRYVEARNLADSDHTSCVTDRGYPSLHWEILNPTNAAGDIAFLNIHDYFSGNSLEMGRTDNVSDSRPNYPVIYRYLYNHDPASGIESCAAPKMGGGLVIRTENGVTDTCAGPFLGDFDDIHGMTLEHVVSARIYAGRGFDVNNIQHCTQRPVWSGIHLRDLWIIESPKNAFYPPHNASSNGMLHLYTGTDLSVDGLTMFDIGNTTSLWYAILARPVASATSPPARNQIRVSNAFITNVDLGSVDSSAGDGLYKGAIDMSASLQSPYNTDTDATVISDSYISGIVGGAGTAGDWTHDFIMNTNLEVDGLPPCEAHRRYVLNYPEDAIGNAITRTGATSCTTDAIAFDNDVTYPNNSVYATRTRRIIGNVVSNMNCNSSYYCACFGSRMSSGENIGIDFYNNVCDGRHVQPGGGFPNEGFRIQCCGGVTSQATFTFQYNAVLNSGSSSYALDFGLDGDYVEGNNSFFDVPTSPPCNTGCAATDVDSDTQNIFVDPGADLYQLRCLPPGPTPNPGGGPYGPLRFGIDSFSNFHPAVMAVMNPLAWKYRDSWPDGIGPACAGPSRGPVRRR